MLIAQTKVNLFKNGLGLRLIFLTIGALGYAVSTGQYLLATIVFAIIESLIWFIYFLLKRKNKIIALGFWGYFSFSSELASGLGFIIFCYGGILRPEAWLLLTVYLIGLIYTLVIFHDRNFNLKAFRQNVKKGDVQAWPAPSELDWFGKIYLYGSYTLMFPALIMFGGAMWATDLSPEEQHKYIMAGGYALMFIGMGISASRIWFRRVIRTVRKYKLDWD